MSADLPVRMRLAGFGLTRGAILVARGSSMTRRGRWVAGVLGGLAVALLTHPTVLEVAAGDAAASWSRGLQSALLLGLAGVVAWVYRDFFGPLCRYLHDHLVQVTLLDLLIGLTWGLGAAFGVPDVIWGVAWHQRFLSGLSATIVLSMLGINAYHLDEQAPKHGREVEAFLLRWKSDLTDGEPADLVRRMGHELTRFLRAARLPFLLLLVVPALFTSLFTSVPRLEVGLIDPRSPWWLLEADLLGLVVWVAGIVAGVVAVKGFLWASEKVAPYVNRVAEAGEGLSQTFREQSAEVAKEAYDFVQWIWDRLLGLWYRIVPDQRLQILPTTIRERVAPAVPRLAERRRALLSFTCVFLLAYLALVSLDYRWVSPGLAVFSLLGMTISLDGLFRLLVSYQWRVRWLALIVLWIAFVNQWVFKLQFDNLAYDERARVELARHDPRIEEASPTRSTAADRDRARQVGPDERVLTPSLDGQRLVSNQESLEAWLARNRGSSGEKPRLTVVSCSGGGMRGAHWAASVLDWLDSELGSAKFRDSVRLISASSAGSVGAGYYVKRLYDQSQATLTPHGQRLARDSDWLEKLPRFSLDTIAPAIALSDVPRIPFLFSGVVPIDRGKRLEMTWDDLRDLPIEELRELERSAVLPSLVLNPIVVEDGRRLFLSNLDLSLEARPSDPGLVLPFPDPGTPFPLMVPRLGSGRRPNPGSILVQRGSALMISPGAVEGLDPEKDRLLIDVVTRIEQGLDLLPPAVQDESLPEDLSSIRDLDPVFSVSGFEFSKLFARERGFRMATGARMAATFPLITPAVYLPTRPAVRVVDSGFRDNYGVELAADWIFQNREWLTENTSGVVLVQIRCFGDPENRRRPADSSGDWLGRGFQFLWSVPQAAANTFSIGAVIRNDRVLAQLGALLNESRVEGTEPFFTTVVFELPSFVRRIPGDPAWPGVPVGSSWRSWEASQGALSWSLTDSEARAIHEVALPRSALARAVDERTRRRRMGELAAELDRTDPDPDRRPAVLWEYERARNYERLQALRRWWTTPRETCRRP